jgi:hypothetical protein
MGNVKGKEEEIKLVHGREIQFLWLGILAL